MFDQIESTWLVWKGRTQSDTAVSVYNVSNHMNDIMAVVMAGCGTWPQASAFTCWWATVAVSILSLSLRMVPL